MNPYAAVFIPKDVMKSDTSPSRQHKLTQPKPLKFNVVNVLAIEERASKIVSDLKNGISK